MNILFQLEGGQKKYYWAKYCNRHSSKSIRVIGLSFCQNDLTSGDQLGKIKAWSLFELCLFQHLAESTILTSRACIFHFKIFHNHFITVWYIRQTFQCDFLRKNVSAGFNTVSRLGTLSGFSWLLDSTCLTKNGATNHP